MGIAGVLPAVGGVSAPTVMGCAAAASACRCYDQAGMVLEMEPQICEAKVFAPAPAKTAGELARALPAARELEAPVAADVAASDGRVIADMRRSPAL
jgi:hypothetical protein